MYVLFYLFSLYVILLHRNDPKFSDRQVMANSVDPDQTILEGAG